MKKKEITKKINESLEEKLTAIDKGEHVACQHLMEVNNKYFCAASCDVNNKDGCIYRTEQQYDPGTTSLSTFYVNHCYQLRKDDLKLILLSKHNHPEVLFMGDNKNKKLAEEE